MRSIRAFVKLSALGFGLLSLISGCSQDTATLEATVVAQAETYIVQTVAAFPEATQQPTYTAEPTHTSQPTDTAQPTLTRRPTLTPEPTYTPRPTYTPLPTHTPKPINTPLPVNTPTQPPPTSSPTDQFTVAGVGLTRNYMEGMRNAYGGCTASSGGGCLFYEYTLNCLYYVNDFNALVARQNLAPQNAEEPVRTAAALYTATVQEFIEVVTHQVAYCQEQLNLGRIEIDHREIGNQNRGRQAELVVQIDQVLEILRQVEAAGNG